MNAIAPDLRRSFAANRAAIAAADPFADNRAVRDATARKALRILQSEIVDTAIRYRNLRAARNQHWLASNVEAA